MTAADPHAIWTGLARDAGIDPSQYDLSQEWHRTEDKRAGRIRLYSGAKGPGVVFKQILRPIEPDRFAALVAAQDTVARSMSDGRNAVPHVLAADLPARAFLMTEARGETCFDLIDATRDHAPILRRAGAWMAAFHRAGFEERRTFRPGFNRKQVLALAAEAKAGTRAIAEADRFAATAERAAAALDAFEGQQTVAARMHGDMNLRNILIDGDIATGIDITQDHSAPVGYDIARFLLHYAELLADLNSLEAGEIVPARALAAFFHGYDLVPPDDPSVQTLLRVRLLNDWAKLPARRRDRTMRETFRLGRIRQIARNAFGK